MITKLLCKHLRFFPPPSKMHFKPWPENNRDDNCHQKKESNVMMHYNNNYLYSQHSDDFTHVAPEFLHWASKASTSLGIFVVAKRYNSSSATKHVSHGHGLVEVTFTLNGHDGNIICISCSNGGGKGIFSYVDMMYQTCRRKE
jgi:hypothetical protein